MRLDVRKVVGRMARDGLWAHDLPASFVVFLVAVPLSLGIAVASGAPAAAGLIAAAVGGIVAGTLGGSALQVSGPAAGLTVVVAGLVAQFGWRVTCGVTVAAGLLQTFLGLTRVARTVLAVSPTVVHAMLAGIGVTIALGQLHVLLGGRAGSRAVDNLVALPGQLADVHGTAALLGLTVIGVLLTWPRLPARTVPGPLVAVVGLTLVAEVWTADVPRVELAGSLAGAVRLPELPTGDWSAAAVAVVTLAAVASVESLISAVALEKLRPGQRTDLDRELVGQGVANMASGLLGGLPVTGVIVRSSTNVLAGATGRASAVLHGVWVLVFWLALGGLIERIPMAVLAGLLVVIGFQLVRPTDLRIARAHGDLPVYVATVVGVVVFGLLEGVLVGVAVSVALVVRRVVRTQVRVVRTPDVGADVPHWTVVAEGTLSFLSVPRLSRTLAQIPAGSVVAVHLLVDFVDHAVSDHLQAWKRQHEASGGTVLLDELALAPRSSR